MVPMPSPDQQPLSEQARKTLLKLAGDSIRHGVQHGSALRVQAADFPPELQARRASFVTLHRQGQLRGCIGHLEPVAPLVEDVVDNAYAAAFRDPRFPALRELELEGLDIHISVLTPATPMQFSSETDLVSQLQPGIDGLILQDGINRGTFLPSVWESLPDPADFVRHLKLKAGLSPVHWSDHLQVSRYETESFP